MTTSSFPTKDLILILLQQDLKHNQLTEGLRQLGLDDAGVHSLDLLPVVARLMGLPQGQVPDAWGATYRRFLDAAPAYPLSHLGSELQPLAERCYEELVGCCQGDLVAV